MNVKNVTEPSARIKQEFKILYKQMTNINTNEIESGSYLKFDKTGKIIIGCDKEVANVIIPDGVKIVGFGAFEGCKMETITIPDSVEVIEASAFDSCKALKEVVLPRKIKGIEDQVFYGCESLECVIVPDGVTYVREYAFADCINLRRLILPDSLVEICNYAFFGCSSLEYLEIPELDMRKFVRMHIFQNCNQELDIRKRVLKSNVNGIKEYVFEDGGNAWYYRWNKRLADNGDAMAEETIYFMDREEWCINRKPDPNKEMLHYEPRTDNKEVNFCDSHAAPSVTIPAQVTYINPRGFGSCTNLTHIKVDPDNKKFADIDGLLYTKDLQRLLCVPPGRIRIRIPEGTKEIGNDAFYRTYDNLQSIAFPNSVEYIGDAFSLVKSMFSKPLRNVVLPDNLKGLGDRTFIEFESLESVRFSDSGKYLTIVDDVLFSKDQTKLIRLLGSKKHYKIPDGVQEIARFAFAGKNICRVDIPDSVKTIGDRAFAFCKMPLHVSIPKSVTDMGKGVFEMSSVLSKKHLFLRFDEKDNTCVSGCLSSAKVVEVPAGVISILAGAFKDCRELESVILPGTLRHINSGAFKGCTSLKSIVIPDRVTRIGGQAFSGCSALVSADIPDNVEEIGESAFYKCSSLKSIVLPKGLKEINDSLFYGCTKLENVTIPDSVRRICHCAFKDCTSLKSVIIPDGVMYIESEAFSNCRNLESVNIHDSVRFISNDAFDNCNKLFSPDKGDNDVVVEPFVLNKDFIHATEAYSQSFREFCMRAIAENMKRNNSSDPKLSNTMKLLHQKALKRIQERFLQYYSPAQNDSSSAIEIDCPEYLKLDSTGKTVVGCDKSVTEVVIPEGITRIAQSAFENCTSLTSVVIPNTVNDIWHKAFKNCSSLNSINIPDSVQYIFEEVFCGCKSLTSVVFPDSVLSVTSAVLKDCSSLKSVKLSENMRMLFPETFSGCPLLTSIKIPKVVENIGGRIENIHSAFAKCTSLKEITVDADNANFTSKDGIVYSKDLETIVACPPGREGELVMPNSVCKIWHYAFEDCRKLTSVVFSQNIQEIGYGAFIGCNGNVVIKNRKNHR